MGSETKQAGATCVVTGAAGGMGIALTQNLAAAGYKVIATDRLPKPAALNCDYVQADLDRFATDERYAAEVLVVIKGRLDGRLDGLVNNAALQVLGGADSLQRGDWHRTLNVNVVAPFLLAQGLLPELEAAQGCIVNISSIHARLTKEHFVAYATSKAALSGLTRALAVDLGPRVRVTAVEPAAIDTPMLQAGFAGKSEAFAALAACHPANAIGSPDTICALVKLLLAEKNGFLTGTVVNIDGGISARLHDPV